MARTSENGEVEANPASSTQNFEPQWTDRGNNIDTTAIKQELLISQDQTSDVTISISSKEWAFAPTESGNELLSSNDIFQGSVLFGSNITDSVSKQKVEKILDQSTSVISKKTIAKILEEIEKLSDMERLCLYFKLPLGRSSDVDPLRMPLNPLGSRPEIQQTVVWIQTHLEEDADISLPKHEVYEEYIGYCTENGVKPLSTADFGKVMKQVFPNVRPRRLGTRGHSRYCYSGLRKRMELQTPFLADLHCEEAPENNSRLTETEMNESAVALVKEWAEKLLGISVTGMSDLANYLMDKLYVDQRSKTAVQWSSFRTSQNNGNKCEDKLMGTVKKMDKDGVEHDRDHMRELKRKLQEQHSIASRRQSVQNRHSKKTKVSPLASSSSVAVVCKEKELKSCKKNAGRLKKGKSKIESSDSEAVKTTCVLEPAETENEASKQSGKIPIPRLHNSPRPSSAIILLPTQSNSPTIGKPKYVPIQPKPSENGNTALVQLKEEGNKSDQLQWEGGSHDEEVANYWSQTGDSGECVSPKANQELSQLRVLLEQNLSGPASDSVNEGKKKPVGGLLERRNVRFETPLGDNSTSSVVTNGTVVPPSPNTRRRAFNFQPISPGRTPDVPPSPGSGGGHLRQLLSGSGINSPFISPRQTPIPTSVSQSQPHSRHNSGHQITLDTPTSIISEVSSASNPSDSAFVSPLNTPLSVNRSRHNSASNLIRARHSSGASITVRHMPYTTPLNHGADSMLNASRSRHSSAGSPSLPRSAPLSPLVQSLTQPSSETGIGDERLRQDLRRRHVSAGMVPGMNRQSSSGLIRAQTMLNNAMPLWGNDPLAQEIEGLLDSATSGVNDSVLNRSQSVPLHQMLQRAQGQVSDLGHNQGHCSISQPNTPFGSGRPFNFNVSTASSPYSCTATPIPSEWNDFNPHSNSGTEAGADGFSGFDADSLREIISEAYASNQVELAPYLDGLGSEDLHPNSSGVDLNAMAQISLQGSSSGVNNMDSDPSLSCSDTGDGFPVTDLSEAGPLPNLIEPEDLAAALVALREAPELSRIVQDVVEGTVAVRQGMR